MFGFGIIVLLSINLIKVSAVGPMCFDCSHISHARYCTNYVQCADDEVCHVQKFVTHNLHEQYSSGCVKNQTCYALQGKRFLDSGFNGLATCFECCHGDMCNNKGCGDHGPPSRDSRGPYCFQCKHMSDPRECDQVTICSTNEVCGLDEAAVGITETEFFSGCKRKMECLSPGGIFGRDLEHKRNGYKFCHQCCDGDFCNMDCVKPNISADNGSWAPWSDWSQCNNCSQIRTRQCVVPALRGSIASCHGNTSEMRHCACTEENGEWGMWSSWTNCNDNGEKERTRVCIGPKTHSLLNNCHGDEREETNCTQFDLKEKLDCDFDVSFCSWRQNTDDDFDWTRNTGNTGTAGTGPMSDHTNVTANGYYIYIETSSRPAGPTALLSSIPINSTDEMCLRFWYNMYGSTIGSLAVYLQVGDTQKTNVWELNGEQGQQWNLGSVTIQRQQPYKIVFEGIRGNGYHGDIALDDISVAKGSCKS